MYILVKHLHVACALASISGFVFRGLLALRNSPTLRSPWVRVLPHINDTVLLAAAIGLAVMSGQYPFVDAWLTAKVFGLIVYIVLGSLALKQSADRRVRIVCGLAALCVFSWIGSVALSKSPAGFLH